MANPYRCMNLSYNNFIELPDDLVEKTGPYVEELDLSFNGISYPLAVLKVTV